MRTAKVNDIVRIRFYDHAHGGEDAMFFEVYGRVSGETKTAYKVSCWAYVNEVDRAKDSNAEDNEDHFIIVKRAIESIRVYR